MEDNTIVSRMWERDDTALAEVQKKYQSYCYAIAKNILLLHEDAEESVNDTWLAAWQSIPPHRPENLKTYLGKLTRTISIDKWRKNHVQKRVTAGYLESIDELEEVISDGKSDVSSGIYEEELSRLISSFLHRLPEIPRNVFIRRYWYHDSIEEICKRFAFSESKTKMILKRTRDKLSNELKKEGYQP